MAPFGPRLKRIDVDVVELEPPRLRADLDGRLQVARAPRAGRWRRGIRTQFIFDAGSPSGVVAYWLSPTRRRRRWRPGKLHLLDADVGRNTCRRRPEVELGGRQLQQMPANRIAEVDPFFEPPRPRLRLGPGDEPQAAEQHDQQGSRLGGPPT